MSTPRTPIEPLAALGLVLIAAGLLAWLWIGEWRFAATGAVLFVVLAAIGAARPRRT